MLSFNMGSVPETKTETEVPKHIELGLENRLMIPEVGKFQKPVYMSRNFKMLNILLATSPLFYNLAIQAGFCTTFLTKMVSTLSLPLVGLQKMTNYFFIQTAFGSISPTGLLMTFASLLLL